MHSKQKIHTHIKEISNELLNFIKNEEVSYKDRWVQAIDIKEKLDLNFVAVPQENKQYGKKGWLFTIIERILEDEGLLEYKNINNKAYYRKK
jgi:hypothetical protein